MTPLEKRAQKKARQLVETFSGLTFSNADDVFQYLWDRISESLLAFAQEARDETIEDAANFMRSKGCSDCEEAIRSLKGAGR